MYAPDHGVCRSVGVGGVDQQDVRSRGGVFGNGSEIQLAGKSGDVVIDVIYYDIDGSSSSQGRGSYKEKKNQVLMLTSNKKNSNLNN